VQAQAFNHLPIPLLDYGQGTSGAQIFADGTPVGAVPIFT
jgi:hypothetical protein